MGFKPSLRRPRRSSSSTNLNITPLIDILICMILFLLVTAMYGKAAILNLYLPTESQPAETSNPELEQTVIPTVAVTKEGFVVNPGKGELFRIPMKNGDFDFVKLHETLMGVHQDPHASNNIIILSEANLKYQALVTTMDTCREYIDPVSKRVMPLFPVVSVGEYRASNPAAAPVTGAP